MNAQRQTNTFQGGMNCDLDYSLIKSSQYNYAENIRIVANDASSTGVMQNIEGVLKTKPSFTLNGEVIAHVSTIRDWAIVFTKKGNKFNIYRYDFGLSKTSPLVTTVASGLDLDIPLVDDHYAVSSVCKWESDDVVKIYWCDGKHQIRILNVAKTYSSFDVDSLDIIPQATLPPLKHNGNGNGGLKAGLYQYCYQLFNPRSNETSLSVLSSLIRANKTDGVSNSRDSFGTKTEENTSKSIKLSVQFDNETFTMAKIIRLYYKDNVSEPTIDVIDEVFLSGTVLNYEDKGGNVISELTTDELNALVSYNFSPKVLESKDDMLFAANVTENTWDISDVEYDARAYRCDQTGNIKLLSVSGSALNFTVTELQNGYEVDLTHDCISPYNDTQSSTDPDSEYKYRLTDDGTMIQGGQGINISYSFVTTDLIEDDAATVNNLPADDWSLNAKAIPISELPLYANYRGSKEKVGRIPLESKRRIPNYADPEIDSIAKGYQRDEIYRFGIVFYNKNNMPSSVHWIADIRMPKATDTNYQTFDCNVRSEITNSSINHTLVTHPLGITFDVNITQTLRDKGVTGFEIVRCERTILDRTVLMQGVLSGVTQHPGMSNALVPFPYLSYSRLHALTSMTDDYRYTWDYGSTQSTEYFRFVSPDICINRENVSELLDKATNIDGVYKLKSTVYPSSSMGDGTHFKKTSWNGTVKEKAMSASRQKHSWDKNGTYKGSVDGSTDDYYRNDGWAYDSVHVNDTDDGVATGSETYAVRIDGCSETRPDGKYNTGLAKYYQHTNLSNSSASVDDTVYASSDDVFDRADNKWKTKPVAIGSKLYYNWTWDNSEKSLTSDDTKGHNNNMRKVGPHGLCAIIHSKNMLDGNSFLQPSTPADAISVKLCNLKQQVNPYGGNTYASRQNSIYISNGNYQTVQIADKQSSVCFGGDTYIGILDYAITTFSFELDTYDADASYNRAYVGAYIPCESTINLSLRNDDVSVSKTYTAAGLANHFAQNEITVIGNLYTQNSPLYTYNSAYSAQPRAKNYISKSMYSIDNLTTDTRVMHSDPKTNLEVTDSWAKFKVSNYLDVDTRFGSVNNMKLFRNNLLFWQTDAFGTLSVNERSLIQDNSMEQLTLGTGGVLTNYSYLTTKNGSRPNQLRVATQSDGAVYWYDADRREICGFDNSLQTVSKLKGVQSYLNDKHDAFTLDPVSAYDKKYNEVLFTLDNNTLVFNEQLGVFTSFYTFKPDWWAEFTDDMFIYKSLQVFKYNSGNELDLFTGKDKVSYIKFIVNDKYPQTKTFDNVEYSGDFTYKTNFDSIYFDTKRQTSFTLTQDDIDYREDTYKFCIPRSSRELNEAEELVNKSYRDRMKGKYLVCHYKYDCNGGNTFKVPYISTAYRHSLI